MGWVSPLISVAAAQQASATGQYNQAVQERNAQISEQAAVQIEKQKEFDIARFEQKYEMLQGQTKVNILKSGADLSGSGLRLMRYNAEQAEIEKNVISFNSKVSQSQKLEQANFSRMQGQIAKQEARQAELGYYAQAGQSLMTNYGS